MFPITLNCIAPHISLPVPCLPFPHAKLCLHALSQRPNLRFAAMLKCQRTRRRMPPAYNCRACASAACWMARRPKKRLTIEEFKGHASYRARAERGWSQSGPKVLACIAAAQPPNAGCVSGMMSQPARRLFLQ